MVLEMVRLGISDSLSYRANEAPNRYGHLYLRHLPGRILRE
jgi:hypothetical protein